MCIYMYIYTYIKYLQTNTHEGSARTLVILKGFNGFTWLSRPSLQKIVVGRFQMVVNEWNHLKVNACTYTCKVHTNSIPTSFNQTFFVKWVGSVLSTMWIIFPRDYQLCLCRDSQGVQNIELLTMWTQIIQRFSKSPGDGDV